MTTRQLKERLLRFERESGVKALVRLYDRAHALVSLNSLERYRAELVHRGQSNEIGEHSMDVPGRPDTIAVEHLQRVEQVLGECATYCNTLSSCWRTATS